MRVYQSLVIDEPIDKVWDFVKPYDSPLKWNPGVVDITMESGRAKEVGAIRHLKIHDGTIFSEELIEYSELQRYYTYKILACPLEINNYIATQQFLEITAGNKTLAIWKCEFNCRKSLESKMQDYFNYNVYAEGLVGIAKCINPKKF